MLLTLSNKKLYSISCRILSKDSSLNNRKQLHSTDPLKIWHAASCVQGRLSLQNLNWRCLAAQIQRYNTGPRVPQCLFLRPNCLPPPPLPPANVSLPPPLETNGGATLAGEGREGAGEANSDDWRESLALCILCAYQSPKNLQNN